MAKLEMVQPTNRSAWAMPDWASPELDANMAAVAEWYHGYNHRMDARLECPINTSTLPEVVARREPEQRAPTPASLQVRGGLTPPTFTPYRAPSPQPPRPPRQREQHRPQHRSHRSELIQPSDHNLHIPLTEPRQRSASPPDLHMQVPPAVHSQAGPTHPPPGAPRMEDKTPHSASRTSGVPPNEMPLARHTPADQQIAQITHNAATLPLAAFLHWLETSYTSRGDKSKQKPLPLTPAQPSTSAAASRGIRSSFATRRPDLPNLPAYVDTISRRLAHARAHHDPGAPWNFADDALDPAGRRISNVLYSALRGLQAELTVELEAVQHAYASRPIHGFISWAVARYRREGGSVAYHVMDETERLGRRVENATEYLVRAVDLSEGSVKGLCVLTVVSLMQRYLERGERAERKRREARMRGLKMMVGVKGEKKVEEGAQGVLRTPDRLVHKHAEPGDVRRR